MTINTNQSPYFNDFNEDKNFHQILFRPGYGVQSRELTQLQSILQNQVSRVGDHLFKQGAMVIPGNTDYDLSVDYIKITTAESYATLRTWIGKTFQGSSSNVKVQLLDVVDAEGLNPITLIVKLVAQGGINLDQKFVDSGETLYDVENAANDVTVQSTNFTGKSSIGYINEGVFYVNGYFVKVYNQSLVLSKYTNKPSVRVGLNVVEEIITDADDSSLLDPAYGSSNENAPGAHRLKINLVLAVYGLNEDVPSDFIDLFTLKNGQLQKLKGQTDYNELEKTLARRTYDESGNYTVDDFVGTLKEHLATVDGSGNIDNDGVYKATEFVGTCSTTSGSNTITALSISSGVLDVGQTISGTGIPANTFIVSTDEDTAIISNNATATGTNVAISGGGNADKLALVVDPGKAYVGGYEITKQSSSYINIDKARDFDTTLNASTRVEYGNYVLVGDLYGLPSLANKPTIELRDGVIDAYGTPVGRIVGYAKATAIEYHSGSVTNVIGTNTGIYKLFLADITLHPGKVMEDVASFHVIGTGTAAYPEVPVDAICGNVLVQYGITNNTGSFTKADVLTGAGGGKAIVYHYDSSNKIVYAKKSDFGSIGTATWALGATTITITAANAQPGMTVKSGALLLETIVSNSGTVLTLASGATAAGTTQAITLYGATTSNIVQGDSFVNGSSVRATALTKTQLFNTTKSPMIFKLAEDFIKSVKDSSNVRDNTYYVRREWSSVVITNNGGQYEAVISANAGETFANPDITNFVAQVTTAGTNTTKGQVINTASAGITWSLPTTNTLKISWGAVATTGTLTIVGSVLKLDTPERTKTYNADSQLVVVPTSGSSLTKINLNKVDVIKVKGIYDSGAVGTAPLTTHLNITDRYILDNGQRDTHYESATLTLTPGSVPPKGQVLVVFDYYAHGAGDYFSVDSYTSNPNFRTDNPTYTTSNGSTMFLLDCLDFRPTLDSRSSTYLASYTAGSTTVTLDTAYNTRMLTVGQKILAPGISHAATISSITNDQQFVISVAATITFTNQIVTVLPNSGSYGFTEFDSNDNVTDVIQNNSTIIATMTYYLSRMDKVALTDTGEWKVFKGVSAKTPTSPSVTESKNNMILFELLIPAYTIKPTDVQVRVFDTRRYTMRDIGKLENRLENVEYYTTLSLLEKSTNDLVIIDPATGLNRFKSGFVVDNFGSNFVADVNNPEYNVAIDTDGKEARPAFTQGNVPLYFDQNNIETQDAGVFGSSIMLPFTNVKAISQPLATSTKNINPFAVFTWQGSMTLDPSVDNWIEINQLPDIVITRTMMVRGWDNAVTSIRYS